MGCIPTKLGESPECTSAISSVEEATRRLIHQLQPLDLNSLELKQVISQTRDLQRMAESYLNNAILNVLKVLSHVGPCIEKAHVNLRVIAEAIANFQEELKSARRGSKKSRSKKIKIIHGETISKLEQFNLADDPFEEINCEELNSLQATLKGTVTQLSRMKRDLEARVSSSKSLRKAWDVLFTGAFVAVLVISVVLAAAGVATAAVAGATATATAMKSGEAWLKSIWEEREKDLEEKQEVLRMMRMAAAGSGGHELENVRVVVEKLRVIVSKVRQDVEFSIVNGDEEAALTIGMEEMKKKMVEVEAGLTQLKEKAAVCADGVKKGAKDFLNAITK